MASYIRSWLPAPWASTDQLLSTPTIVSEPPESEVDDDDTATIRGDDDDDEPPAFPSLNSAQRADSSGRNPAVPAVPRILSDSDRMPPPPMPTLSTRTPGVPSASTSLSVPASRGSLAPPLSTTKAPTKKSRKVALAPGHGPLDWANLKKSGRDLRGVDSIQRITPSELKRHNKKDDVWSAFNGKVYNITWYLPYHPGGEKELMRVAGRDGTKLFSSTHGWVNVDYMLDECLVGFLVPEP